MADFCLGWQPPMSIHALIISTAKLVILQCTIKRLILQQPFLLSTFKHYLPLFHSWLVLVDLLPALLKSGVIEVVLLLFRQSHLCCAGARAIESKTRQLSACRGIADRQSVTTHGCLWVIPSMVSLYWVVQLPMLDYISYYIVMTHIHIVWSHPTNLDVLWTGGDIPEWATSCTFGVVTKGTALDFDRLSHAKQPHQMSTVLISDRACDTNADLYQVNEKRQHIHWRSSRDPSKESCLVICCDKINWRLVMSSWVINDMGAAALNTPYAVPFVAALSLWKCMLLLIMLLLLLLLSLLLLVVANYLIMQQSVHSRATHKHSQTFAKQFIMFSGLFFFLFGLVSSHHYILYIPPRVGEHPHNLLLCDFLGRSLGIKPFHHSKEVYNP